MTDTTRKLARWRLSLSELDTEAVHRTVVNHQAAEALSQLPRTALEESSFGDNEPELLKTETQPWDKKTEKDINILT